MPGPQATPTVIPFGPFEADLRAQELRKLGVHLRLPHQSFQILQMLLEHPGELVTREEMRSALWPADTFVDFEHGLNAAINRLRHALGDDADNPRYIETLPRRGYRFLAPFTQPALIKEIGSITNGNLKEEVPKIKRRNWWAIGLGLACACALAATVLYSLRPQPPRVSAYRQLTKDLRPKAQTPCGYADEIVTDGPRIFFSEPSSLMQVSANGGDTVRVSAPFSCFRIFDISPDRTELLGASHTEGHQTDQPLWVLSIASGLARRVSDLRGHAGAWSPDGQSIAYATGNDAAGPNDLYIAAKDGSKARKVTTFEKGHILHTRWSPDGSILRMNVSSKLWQVRPDGSDLYRVFSDRDFSLDWLGEIGWTAGGRYFVFQAPGIDRSYGQLWAFREAPSLFSGKVPKPSQLTFGAMSFGNPAPSPDGKHIFTLGAQSRGELVRYDLRSKRLEPYLSGISADQLDFSRDGQWVAYVTFPDGRLWRSKVDGSERLQLTNPHFVAELPRWSPDGTRIVFSGGLLSDQFFKIYVVSAAGGKPELVSDSQLDQLDPTWMPDGNSVIFGEKMQTTHPHISMLNLHSGRITSIPGSEGLFSPRVSPDGRFITAVDAASNRKLLLFDQKTQKWSELLVRENSLIGWQVWSADSKSVYITDISNPHLVHRIRIADRKIDRVAAFEVPEGITGFWNGWVGMAPDGSPLILRDLSLAEIYALDVDLP